MIDIETANTKTIGIQAAAMVSAATIAKIKAFYEKCYGKGDEHRKRNILERTEEYFVNALQYHFQNADFLYSTLPNTIESKFEAQDIYTAGYFMGYLAAVADTDALHNEIEMPENADE